MGRGEKKWLGRREGQHKINGEKRREGVGEGRKGEKGISRGRGKVTSYQEPFGRSRAERRAPTYWGHDLDVTWVS